MKKIMAGVLTGVMLISAIQPVCAVEEWLTYGNGTTSIKYSTYTGSIKRATGTNSTQDHAPAVNIKPVSISIPTKINGTEITAVEKNGFFDFDELGSIELPSTLTTFGDMAFMGADNLTEINIPDKVTAISKACFKSCDSLASVKIGKSVTDIADQAFSGCKALTSIKFGTGVKTIGLSTFELCTSLTDIALPTSLTALGDSAFKDCKALTQITIPSGVTRIEANTFSGCKALKVAQINGNITVIGKNAFKDCGELTDIYIPASCKKIEDNAFDGCKKVTIHCDKGSAAESFAVAKKITYVNDKALTSTIDTDIDVPDTITVAIDGRTLDFNGVEPQIVNGCTMVPMRAIFEELGCVMEWNADTKTVTASRGVTSIVLTVNKKKAYINGKEHTLDAAPCVVNGSTLVPVRFIGEALGCEVRWNAATRTATIVTK
jgi:hypothetical protein